MTEIITGQLKLEGQDGKPVKVIVGAPATTKRVISSTKDEKTAVWTTVAPKDGVTLRSQDGKNIAVWAVTPDAKVTGKPAEAKALTWSFVEADGKGGPHAIGVYKLPKGKAGAVAGFLKENAKSSSLEVKVEGDTLTVKGNPEAIKAIASMISLMQGQGCRGRQEGHKGAAERNEFRVIPDGKDTSFKGFDTKSFVKWPAQNIEFNTNFAKFNGESFKFTEFQPNINWQAAPFVFEGKAIEGKGAVKP